MVPAVPFPVVFIYGKTQSDSRTQHTLQEKVRASYVLIEGEQMKEET